MILNNMFGTNEHILNSKAVAASPKASPVFLQSLFHHLHGMSHMPRVDSVVLRPHDSVDPLLCVSHGVRLIVHKALWKHNKKFAFYSTVQHSKINFYCAKILSDPSSLVHQNNCVNRFSKLKSSRRLITLGNNSIRAIEKKYGAFQYKYFKVALTCHSFKKYIECKHTPKHCVCEII